MLRSQILTVESADPEAKMFLWVEFKDSDKTESVWDPYLNFLALLLNFLAFFFLLLCWAISPPRVRSGSTASTMSRFQISISGKKDETMA